MNKSEIIIVEDESLDVQPGDPKTNKTVLNPPRDSEESMNVDISQDLSVLQDERKHKLR